MRLGSVSSNLPAVFLLVQIVRVFVINQLSAPCCVNCEINDRLFPATHTFTILFELWRFKLRLQGTKIKEISLLVNQGDCMNIMYVVFTVQAVEWVCRQDLWRAWCWKP